MRFFFLVSVSLISFARADETPQRGFVTPITQSIVHHCSLVKGSSVARRDSTLTHLLAAACEEARTGRVRHAERQSRTVERLRGSVRHCVSDVLEKNSPLLEGNRLSESLQPTLDHFARRLQELDQRLKGNGEGSIACAGEGAAERLAKLRFDYKLLQTAVEDIVTDRNPRR